MRRVAAGERVNDVDWTHVIEEIEDVGKSILKAVRSLLRRAIEHALKARAMPADDAAAHWLQEAATFLRDAQDRYEPGMAQHIDVERIWRRARRAVAEDYQLPPDLLPEAAPAFTVAELMDPDTDLPALLRRLAGDGA